MNAYQHHLNGTRPAAWRETPAGQPTVADLVQVGMTVRSSYGTGGIVVAVRGPYTQFLSLPHAPAWSILYVQPADYGRHGTVPAHWPDNPKISCLNDIVAVDGRLLNLCTGNDDETHITNTARLAPVDRRGQIGLIL